MKTRLIIICGLLAVIFALAFIACDNGSVSGKNPDNNNGTNTSTEGNGTDPGTGGNGNENGTGNGNGSGGSPMPGPGSTLAAKLAWLSSNAVSDTAYTFEVTADEAIAYQTLSYANKSGITIILKGIEAERTISLSSNGSLFTVESGVKLVLDNNITLRGGNDYFVASAVQVSGGGALEMKAGAKISGFSSYVVYVYGDGIFTMNGGEISGNTSSSGGGVYVIGGIFTMNGGEISDNTSSLGGGVFVSPRYVNGVSAGGIFTMNDGEISGNTSSGDGGGVYMSGGTFTMNGGKISGNISSSQSSRGGGGVLAVYGTFTMNDGEISGNTATLGGGGVSATDFIMNGGKISGNISTAESSGGGVFANGTFTMNDGEISGNTATLGGGVYVGNVNGTFTMKGGTISGNTATYPTAYAGGGVFVGGTFRIVTGTIYGSNAGTLSNTATAGLGAAFVGQVAQRGTFDGETWNSKGDLILIVNRYTNDTIRVLNGELVQ
jgi:hypothetical protein